MDSNFIKYIEKNLLELNEYAKTDLQRAWGVMDRMRCPLHSADQDLYNDIFSVIEDYCTDNDIEFDDLNEMEGHTQDPEDLTYELFND